ncbi:UNVERIFIED_CONTAM: hypothetical protein Sradi_3637600 [Sesamum radiatum]|uniref:Uncharacterized protein n=1 Tax=Sesamum radiatum TaxID=300843 RepID=A0AAW2QI09_SESRA
MLYYQARKGYSQSDESRPNEVALEFAAGAVNVFTGRDWDMDFYKNKLRILRLRYETFQ